MNPLYLIPYTEPIPAPAEIFIILEQLFFLIHIIIINSIVGLSLIILYQWNKKQDFFIINKPLAKKIPILFALGINMAIPALLFLQVVFGHLFYTSSILMGTFWILIIPFLIIAYYSAYFHYKKFEFSGLAKYALVIMIIIIFYIAFMLVNNLSMMEMPKRWETYFSNRDGTILLWNVASIYPRFLHFLIASIAVGGIAYSLYFRKKSEDKVREGLKIFAYATMFQIVIGFWFILSLPQNIMQKYIGGDLFATVVFILSIITAFLSIFIALKANIKGSLLLVFLTLVFMVINRYNLRVFHLGENFNISQLKLSPQWDVFTIFLVILLLGIAVIFYMLKITFSKTKEAKK
ncbi:hypothetical protein [Thermodesulfovibrio yellowstonii]|uniref:hypothetical protein n=1 Tax=Thermodesulfovibrio yellowstonii TaxID=28262 RepID=UPI0024B3883D|nr:hypothetical protein [Thermodesulfovibrio yellowstonii]MDI6865231.1 hypothetical protein [Thermodesulfovibrio yellowstonii]